MNNILAQYLFNKEIIYSNPTRVAPTDDSTATIAAERKISAPAQPAKIIETPQLIKLELKHQVVIITKPVSDQEKEFLAKIIGAVGLSLTQIDLIEISQASHFDYPAFIAQQTTTRFISFGVSPDLLSWDIQLVPYQIKKMSGIDFLMANDLGTIYSDTSHKKNLWTALQQMFGR